MKNNNRLEMLFLSLLNIKPMLPGLVIKRETICGKPNCRCMNKENPKKHILYQLNYTLKSKSSNVYIKKKELPSVLEMTKSYKKLRQLTLDIAVELIESYRENGAVATSALVNKAFDKARSKILGGKPESGKLRDAKISRDNWKTRASSHHKKLRKNIVVIRDLKDSRNNWHNQTINLKKENE